MYKLAFIFLSTYCFLAVNGAPFLYNVVSLLGSASAASSFPQPENDNSNENIADLRKLGVAKLQEVTTTPKEINEFSFVEDPQTNNGFVPSLIEKKVGKILRKFAFLTMFANSGNNGNDGEIPDFGFEEKAPTTTGNSVNEIETVSNPNSTENSASEIENFQEKLPNRVILFDENGRINREVRVENQQQRFFTFPQLSDIGLYFIELFGSLAGLFYGATGQLNRPNNDSFL